MPSHVFISYARADVEVATHVATVLASRGLQIWYDARIEVGSKWAQRIEAAIDTSFAVVLLMSGPAQRSDWVKREIDRAELRNRPLFPLLVNGEVFAQFADRQFDHCDGARWEPNPTLVDRLTTLQEQARDLRFLHFCTKCRRQYVPEDEPYCSYHSQAPRTVGNVGPRSNYEDVWEYPCCKRKVVTAVDDGGRDLPPPMSPGCVIKDEHAPYTAPLGN